MRLLATAFACVVSLAGCTESDAPGDPATEATDAAPTPAVPLGGLPTASYETTLLGDPVDVYHPTDDAYGPYPLALFLQGGRVDKSEYAGFAAHLASYGFVVLVPNHDHLVVFPGFEAEGLFSEQQQILDALDFARDEVQRAGATAAGLIDTSRFVLLGHSYGAAAAFAAIQGVCEFPFCPQDGEFALPEELRSMALLGINTKPRVGSDQIRSTANAGMPLAIINGRLDSNATADETTVSYERIADPPKALMFIEGANHYAMCDRNNPDGPAPDPAEPTMPPEESVELSARYAALWLRATGLNDARARSALEDADLRIAVSMELP